MWQTLPNRSRHGQRGIAFLVVNQPEFIRTRCEPAAMTWMRSNQEELRSCSSHQTFEEQCKCPSQIPTDRATPSSSRARTLGGLTRSRHGALVTMIHRDANNSTRDNSNVFICWRSNSCKRTLPSTFGAEAGACRSARSSAQYARAMFREVLYGYLVTPDRWRNSTCRSESLRTARASMIVWSKKLE